MQYCYPGTTPEQVVDAWMSMLADLPQERLDIVDRVRAKAHKVYLLSNGNDLHFNFINRTYNLASHFDGLFLSQAMHMAKPEPQIYKAVNEQIKTDVDSPNVIFVDDIETNRLAAQQTVGWTTFPDLESLLANTDF